MEGNDFLLVKEKHLKYQINLMAWSPKRDLVAMATDNGELILYRLSGLEKVWSLSPPDKGCLINALTWRPDGSVVAVGYNSKESGIQFVYMEKSQVVWRLSDEHSLLRSSAVLLRWFELDIADFNAKQYTSLSFKDYIADLPKLPSKDVTNVDIKSIIGSTKKPNDLICIYMKQIVTLLCIPRTHILTPKEYILQMLLPKRFHLLMVCDETNTLTLFAYGVFPLLSIPYSSFGIATSITFQVEDMYLSSDFKSICTVLSTTEKNSTSCSMQMFDVSSIMNNLDVCEMIAEKSCHLSAIMTYMENILDLMNESCETVVQEMESKLTKYLINKTLTGTIGDEFMHYLLWGKPSDVLHDLLMHCMTQKSVMKLGTLVEASYTSIQQLLLVNFQLAFDALYFHLSELKGMSIPTVLGNLQLLNPDQISEVMNCAGSFILKGNEMQQVIGQSLKNFKAFFRWLYSSIVKIHGETLEDVAQVQMSVKELELVADFVLESFIHEHEQLKMSGREKHFNLDKVYQYLQSSPLSSPQCLEGNDWFRLIESTPSLANNPSIIKRRPEASLRQLFIEVKTLIRNLTCSSATSCNSPISKQSLAIAQPSMFKPHSCLWYATEDGDESYFCTLMTISSLPCKELLLTKFGISSRSTVQLRVKFACAQQSSDGAEEQFSVSDFAFYSEQLITMVLQHGATASLVQVSLPSMLQDLQEHGNESHVSSSYVCDAAKFIMHRCVMSPMIPVKVASSGTRKVACVIDAKGRHIKAYDMDQTNDEDDEIDDDEFDNSMTLS